MSTVTQAQSGSREQATVREVLDGVRADGRNALSAPEAKKVCDAYGIPVPGEALATTAEEAVSAADEMGYPVVAKIVSPDILHKTEAKGVLVGLKSADEVSEGFDTIVANAKAYKSDADITGVQVQQMLPEGQEVLVGAIKDPSFGPVVTFGLGGILVEVLRDVTFRLAPTSADEAMDMVNGIKTAEVLRGVRGRPGVDQQALASTIQAVSELVTDFPEITEVDLNPVLATPEGATAVDARFIVDFDQEDTRPPRYSNEEILETMTRMFKPRGIAVIGASESEGKIGNSVMQNLVNGGFQGEIYPINPKADEILGKKAYKDVSELPDGVDLAVFCIPAKFVVDTIAAVGDKGIAAAVLIPSGFSETGEEELQQPAPGDRARARRALHRPEHLRDLLPAAEHERRVHDALRPAGHDRAGVAERRHRHGHPRVRPFDQARRRRDRRPGQQGRRRRGRPADVLRAGRQHAVRRPAHGGPQGRPLLRRGRQARLAEEADRRPQGGRNARRRLGGGVAHRGAGRRRQGLRRHPAPGRRRAGHGPARPARAVASAARAADPDRRERRDHHRRGRVGRAAVGRLLQRRPHA